MEEVKFFGGDLNGTKRAVAQLGPLYRHITVIENDGAGPFAGIQKAEVYQLKWWENGQGEPFPVYQLMVSLW